MFKKISAWAGLALALFLTLPGMVLAAGGGASDLVMVADTRNLHGFSLYIANLYNVDRWMFAVWSVVLTTALGAGLGILMDWIMSKTGLDLGKTKKVEN